MIVPGQQNFTAYIGSTFDTTITVYPQADASFNWVGPWVTGTNYSIGTVVIGTDNNAYDALRANISVNPVGDLTGTWSTPLTPLNLNGYSGLIWIGPTVADELDAQPILTTPVQIQGTQGAINIKFTPAQSATPTILQPDSGPIEPGTYHHWISLTDPTGNTYYYLNGNFTWVSP